MIKKLLFIGLVISIIINVNNLSAETSIQIPLKKPSLTNKEHYINSFLLTKELTMM